MFDPYSFLFLRCYLFIWYVLMIEDGPQQFSVVTQQSLAPAGLSVTLQCARAAAGTVRDTHPVPKQPSMPETAQSTQSTQSTSACKECSLRAAHVHNYLITWLPHRHRRLPHAHTHARVGLRIHTPWHGRWWGGPRPLHHLSFNSWRQRRPPEFLGCTCVGVCPFACMRTNVSCQSCMRPRGRCPDPRT